MAAAALPEYAGPAAEHRCWRFKSSSRLRSRRLCLPAGTVDQCADCSAMKVLLPARAGHGPRRSASTLAFRYGAVHTGHCPALLAQLMIPCLLRYVLLLIRFVRALEALRLICPGCGGRSATTAAGRCPGVARHRPGIPSVNCWLSGWRHAPQQALANGIQALHIGGRMGIGGDPTIQVAAGARVGCSRGFRPNSRQCSRIVGKRRLPGS